MTTASANVLYTRLTHFAGAQSLPSYHAFTSSDARRLIEQHGLAMCMCAERLSFKAFYEQCYGEPLEPKVRRRA